MKAVICTKYGPPEVLVIKDVPIPVPKDNEVLIQVKATAVNSGDVRVRSLSVTGWMKIVMRLVLGINKPRKPILGTVYAGIVVSVGNKVSKLKSGDQVFGMTGFNFGTYAEYIIVKENSNILSMPRNATYEEAAAIIFGGQTAIRYLDKAQIATKNNPEILIIGASGAVGTAAVQLAKHHQAIVTAVCSSHGEKLVRALGVHEIICYDIEDYKHIRRRFDIIFDAVGKSSKKECQHLLKVKGVYKNVNKGYASEHINQLQLLKELYEQGDYKAVIDKTYSIEDVVEAHRYVDTGRKKGNVVLSIN